MNRLLERTTGIEKGKTALFIAGMHGNEPAGVQALERVFSKIKENKILIKGEFLGVLGNIPALQKNARFSSRDLNRKWTEEKINSLIDGQFRNPEDRQQLELYHFINKEISTSAEIILFDLHTTSSDSCPFQSAFGDTKLRLTDNIPVPVIQNIFTEIPSTLLRFFGTQQIATYLFEGGQHEDPNAIDNHEAYIWLCLENLGMLELSENENYTKTLVKNCSVGSGKYDISYTYNIEEGEEFQMLPGFLNFSEVKKGQPLAKNSEGPISCPISGRIFMPLYQKSGNEGFFILQESKVSILDS